MKSRMTPQEIKNFLIYDKDTGRIYRRDSGKETGLTTSQHGYRVLSLKGQQYYVHRVAWAIHYGAWPDNLVDHVNQDKVDNRIANLRDVTNKENLRNQRRSRANSSGVTGVHLDPSTGFWVAQIKISQENIYLGRYENKAEAVAARKAAEKCLGFSRMHGSV